LEDVQAQRTQMLLDLCDRIQPDVLMVELFPFGRRKFSFELIPLIERSKTYSAKVVCSLRDIVVTKQNREKHEAKVCTLMNQYFDALLIHGDPAFQPIAATFSRIEDLTCETHYTGYVVQPQPQESVDLNVDRPLILASVGGGRFGHELLDAVLDAAPSLERSIPHQIQMFTGPFMPDDKFAELQGKAAQCPNVRVDRFTPHLLSYMRYADLSISMSGYNTTMNVLTTGVRAMLLAFTGNDDQEQRIRSEKLAQLGVITLIERDQLTGDRFAQQVINTLQTYPKPIKFDCNGVAKTAALLKQLVNHPQLV
jgi:predicted glycosyltransferase